VSKILVLDAGHSLNTAGKETYKGSKGVIKEWSMNDSVCRKIQSILKDFDVTIYRTDDATGKTDISLSERVKRCNNYNADLFVSIHHNAYSNTTATGTEVYMHTNGTSEDKKLADLVAPKLAQKTGLKNRGSKKASFAVLTCKATAILCEGGFMTTKKDYEVITTDSGQQAYAEAVAECVISFLGLKKKTTTATTNTNKVYQVICGSYSQRSNAEKTKAQLEKAGFSGVWINVK
jgi:N-acetylmuramoyl-L-alanine amidase